MGTPLPDVPNVCKVKLSGTIGPNNWAIILHCQWSGTSPSVASLNALAAAVEAAWSNAAGWKILVPASTIITEVTCTDLTTSSGNTGVWTGSVAGTNAGSEIAANTAQLINYPSSFRYRGGHPRSYFPPQTASALATANTWGSVYIADAKTAFELIQNVLGTTTSGGTNYIGQVAVSYVNAALFPTPPHYRTSPIVMAIPYQSEAIPAKVASQRRRAGRK